MTLQLTAVFTNLLGFGFPVCSGSSESGLWLERLGPFYNESKILVGFRNFYTSGYDNLRRTFTLYSAFGLRRAFLLFRIQGISSPTFVVATIVHQRLVRHHICKQNRLLLLSLISKTIITRINVLVKLFFRLNLVS